MDTNADANDARLAHAKKLLTKFQNRQQQQRNMGSDMLDVEFLEQPSTNAAATASQPPSIGTQSMEQSLHSSRSSSFVNIDQTGISSLNDQNGSQQSASPSEVHSLRQALAEKEHHLSSTLTKLQALHNHYAELHQAYSDLRSKQPDGSDFSQQIGQLQTALAIAVGEKTQLQTELRNANGHQNALKTEIEFLRSQAKGTINNAQLISQEAENQQLHEKLTNQSTTIAQQRTECAELEAKIVMLNQDKNDIQARLKFVYQEKDEINARLNELKNELSIKEIYIRQLAKHSSADSTQGQQTIQTLTEQKNFFETECQRHARDAALLKNEFETSRRQYEECLAQLRAHSTTLEQTIEQLTNQKRQLEFSKFCLEEELQLLRKSAHENLSQAEKVEDPVTNTSASDSTTNEQPQHSQFDYDALNNSYQRMELEFQRQTILIGQLNLVLEERDAALEKLQHQTTEDEHRIQRLEAQIQHLQQMGTDVSQLSSQLQNERATVSRAVAQNMELKEQFGELQDKLIKITNDCAQAEDEKSNALALVERLSRKIEEMEPTQPQLNNSLSLTDNRPISTSTPNQDNVTQTDHSYQHENQAIVAEPLNYSHIGNVRYPDHDQQNAGHQHTTENVNTSNADSRNESDSTNTTYSYVEESASTTPNTVEVDAMNQQVEEESTSLEQYCNPEDVVQDFLTNPKSSDSEFTRQLRTTFYKLQESTHDLSKKVGILEKLNDEYKQANDRLQYWLTSVESENESIGDFIELYRMQRAQIQAKVVEKEEECDELRKSNDQLESKIKHLHNALFGFLKKSQRISDIPDNQLASTNDQQQSDSSDQSESTQLPTNCAIHDLMGILTQMSHDEHSQTNDVHLKQLAQTLQHSSIQFNPDLHCKECRGELYDL